jgi:hypothetical protein
MWRAMVEWLGHLAEKKRIQDSSQIANLNWYRTVNSFIDNIFRHQQKPRYLIGQTVVM